MEKDSIRPLDLHIMIETSKEGKYLDKTGNKQRPKERGIQIFDSRSDMRRLFQKYLEGAGFQFSSRITGRKLENFNSGDLTLTEKSEVIVDEKDISIGKIKYSKKDFPNDAVQLLEQVQQLVQRKKEAYSDQLKLIWEGQSALNRKGGTRIKEVPTQYKKDPVFIMTMLKESIKDYKDGKVSASSPGRVYEEWFGKNTDVSLKNNKKFILEALKVNPNIFPHIGENLKKDPEVVLTAIKHSFDYELMRSGEKPEKILAGWVIKDANKDLYSNESFVRDAIKLKASSLKYIPDNATVLTFLLWEIRTDPKLIQFAPEKFLNRDTSLKAVQINPDCFQYVKYKNDELFIVECLQQCCHIDNKSEEPTFDKKNADKILESVKLVNPDLYEKMVQIEKFIEVFPNAITYSQIQDLSKAGYVINEQSQISKNGNITKEFDYIIAERAVFQDPIMEFIGAMNDKKNSGLTLEGKLSSFLLGLNEKEVDYLREPISNNENEGIPIRTVKSLGMANTGNQNIFNNGMEKVIDFGANLIKEKRGNFDGLFALCANGRFSIARDQNIKDAQAFGRSRGYPFRSCEVSARTPVQEGSYYEKLGQDLSEQLDKKNREFQVEPFEELKNPEKYPKTFSAKRSDNENTLVFYFKAQDSSGKYRAIPLSEYKKVPEGSFENDKIEHTDPRSIPFTHKGYEKLFNEALQINDEKACKEKLLEFFWLFAQSKDFFRGDPAIGEMLCAIVCRAKGWEFQFKPGVVQWSEVSKCDDIEKFGKSAILV